MAIAALALAGLTGTNTWALSLGRISVQSALGEPLRAEIDVPDITAEEFASLRTIVAAPGAFVVAGFEYNPVMSNLQFNLQRLPDAAEETIRIIHIGDYDACPCSGQHVASTKAVGTVRIVSTTYEEGALRVRFKLDR